MWRNIKALQRNYSVWIAEFILLMVSDNIITDNTVTLSTKIFSFQELYASYVAFSNVTTSRHLYYRTIYIIFRMKKET